MNKLTHRVAAAFSKSYELIRNGKTDLLISIPAYYCWRKLRGLDFGVVFLEDLGFSSDQANYHMESGGPCLRDLLAHLKISTSDSILDLGSGKGGAMATLSAFPFKNVDGVELSPGLANVARLNFRKLKLEQCRVFVSDASVFTDLDDYTYIFMYNPFPEAVLCKVLDNVSNSLKRRWRPLRILYSNPVHAQVVTESGIFIRKSVYKPYSGYHGIHVYEAIGK